MTKNEKKTVVLNFITEEELHSSRIYYELEIPRIVKSALIIIASIFVMLFSYIIFAPYNVVVKAPAQIKACNEAVHIVPLISGKLKEKFFTSGHLVNSGDILYIIENNYLEIELGRLIKQQSEIEKIITRDECLIQLIENYEKEGILPDFSLCEIENSFLAELKKIEIEVNKTKSEYESEFALYPAYTSKQNIEMYKKNMETAELNLKGFVSSQKKNYFDDLIIKTQEENEIKSNISKIEKEISQTIIKAPVTGYVEELTVISKDENIIAESLIAKIIPQNTSCLRVNIFINIEDIAELESGMPFSLSFSKYPISEYSMLKGYIDFIPKDSKVMNDGNNIYQVTGILDEDYIKKRRTEKKISLVSGMNATCKILTRKEPLYIFLFEKLGLMD